MPRYRTGYRKLTGPSWKSVSDSNRVCLVLNTWFESEELWSWRHVSQLLGLGKTFNKNVLLVLLKTMFRVLPPTIKPYYNLIRCRTGLIWVVNRAISRLFNSCFSNVVRQVACFSFWIFFFLPAFPYLLLVPVCCAVSCNVMFLCLGTWGMCAALLRERKLVDTHLN